MVAEKNVIYTGPQDGICAVVIDTTMKTADWIIFGNLFVRISFFVFLNTFFV